MKSLFKSILSVRPLVGGVLLSVLAFCDLAVAADSPTYIPFQGQVTNQGGTVVADGQYSIIFNLYDQAVGGQPVWSERHVKVGVTRGMVNVFLGSIAPFDKGTPATTDDVDFSQTKYLGITVDTDNLATTADPEMVPRSLILPAFYAQNSAKMRGYDWSALFQDNAPTPQPTNDIASGFLKPSLFGNNTIDASKLINGSVGFASLSPDVISGLGGSLTQGSLIPSMTALEAIANRDAVAITKDAGNNVRLLKANSSTGSRSAFYGFAVGAAALNAPVTIHQFGALNGFTGLSAGSSYYVGTTDGAITSIYPAGNPIYVGYALAADTLFVDPFGVTKKWSSQNYWGNGSDGAFSTTDNVALAVPVIRNAYDGDVVVKQYTSLTINAGHTMTTAQPCRGLVIYVDGNCTINGTLSMSRRGANVDPTQTASISPTGIRLVRRKTGATETLSSSDVGGTGLGGVGSAWRSIEALQPGIANNGKIFTVARIGGAGGAAAGLYSAGNPGLSMVDGLGGGGSSSGSASYGGTSGSAGTCFSGGSGGGGNPSGGATSSADAGAAFGGTGGNGGSGNPPSNGGGGGAGNPGGAAGGGSQNGSPGQSGTGGLLILFVRGNLIVGGSGIISADGANGGAGGAVGGSGGGSGGGRVIILHAGGLQNSGLVRAAGGLGGTNQPATYDGYPGGNGAITFDQIDP